MQNPTSVKLEIEHLLFELSCCISDLDCLRQHMSQDELNQSHNLAIKLHSLNESNTSYVHTCVNH